MKSHTGTVLITFKNPRSIPPYRIENQCDDVFVTFAQTGVARDRSKWNTLQPRQGGSYMAYAWDEPILQHRLTVQVWTYHLEFWNSPCSSNHAAFLELGVQ